MGCSAKYCNEKNYYKYNQENLDLGQLDEPLSPEEKVPIIDENIGQNEKSKKNPNNFPYLNETTVNTLKRYNEWTQLKETKVNTPKKKIINGHKQRITLHQMMMNLKMAYKQKTIINQLKKLKEVYKLRIIIIIQKVNLKKIKIIFKC